MMFCKQCGTQLDDKALFCMQCGAKTDNAQQPVQQPTQPVYQQPAQPAYVQQPVYQQPYVQPAAPAPKKGNGKLIAIIIAAVAVIAAIAVAVVLIFGGNDSGGKSEPTEAGGSKNNFDLGSEGAANAMIGSLQNLATANGMDFELVFEMEQEMRYRTEFSVEGSVLFDLETKDLMLSAEATMDDETRGVYAYDGYLMAEEDGEVRAVELAEVMKHGFNDVLEAAEAYDVAGLEFSGEALVGLLTESLSKDELKTIEQVITLDDLADAVDELVNSLNDDDWLSENLDSYSRTDKNGVTQISLEVNSFDFLDGVLDIFLPALDFESLEEISGESVDEEELREQLEDMIDDRLGAKIDFALTLDIAIEDDFVRDLEFSFETDSINVRAKAHFENVGNPSIDEDALVELLEDAEMDSFNN
ncbi:MAG: zinc-ribbon domain-containing protein [Clostridia bacterium]|nr:zinc-ribbon domain-containing protein [Clostridia bacterium]